MCTLADKRFAMDKSLAIQPSSPSAKDSDSPCTDHSPKLPDPIDYSPEKQLLAKHQVQQGHSAQQAPVKQARAQNDACQLEASIQHAHKIFGDSWNRFMIDFYWKGDKRASALAEIQLSEQYDDLCASVLGLLPWTKTEVLEQSQAGDRSYEVMQFHGTSSGRKLPQSLIDDEEAKIVSELEHLRKGNMQFCAREALCAVLAILSSRKEKNWLDGQDAETQLKDKSKWKQSKGETRLGVALADLASKQVRGWFTRALVESASTFRLAFAKGEARSRPASLIVTLQLPFKEALEHMDGDGPLGVVSRKWFKKASRQFAIQDLCAVDSHAEGKWIASKDNERQHVRTLTDEPQIKELFGNGKPVILLDVLAALGPREMAKQHGISQIVRAELASLLSQAKAQKVAVVFMLGGEDPHALAHKVYLQPPFTDYGLRCGYLRWRESAKEPWAREKQCWEDRVCIGLQLP